MTPLPAQDDPFGRKVRTVFRMKVAGGAWLLGCVLAAGAGCLGGSQSRSGEGRTPLWYDERAGASAAEADERLRRLEEATERLDTSFRRMHADLGGQLDDLRTDLDVLIAKLDAQHRWLSQVEELVRRTEQPGTPGRPGLDATGLPQADARVARFDSRGQPVIAPQTVWDDPASPVGSQTDPTTDEARMPLLPAGERTRVPGGESGRSDAGAPAVAGEDSAAAVEPLAEGEERSANEARRLYEVAYQDLMRENYQLALINFRSFLERYPATALSDNAQYWIGEVYYAQGQFHLAVEEFRKVVENYPGHEKVPAAYVKIALCFQKMQDVPTARRYLEYVLQNYPETREARLAQERLEQF